MCHARGSCHAGGDDLRFPLRVCGGGRRASRDAGGPRGSERSSFPSCWESDFSGIWSRNCINVPRQIGAKRRHLRNLETTAAEKKAEDRPIMPGWNGLSSRKISYLDIPKSSDRVKLPQQCIVNMLSRSASLSFSPWYRLFPARTCCQTTDTSWGLCGEGIVRLLRMFDL